MTSHAILPAKTDNEVLFAKFPFQSQLAVNETISSATVTAAVYSGTDPSPGSIISGAATIISEYVATTVQQKLTGGVEGVIYILTCIAISSLAQTLSMTAYLAVVPDAT